MDKAQKKKKNSKTKTTVQMRFCVSKFSFKLKKMNLKEKLILEQFLRQS
jgi:hypothetical protein